MKKLVAFYSRAGENYFGGQYRFVDVGNTEKAARMIAEAAGAPLFRIEQETPYSQDYKTCVAQAKQDYETKARPRLVELPDISDVDEIYLGYPNYCGTMPMAVYTFLESLDFSGKTIHPFCTHEGSGLSRTEADIAQTVPTAQVARGLAIFGNNVDEAGASVEKWIHADA